MPIPDFHNLMLPLLQLAVDGAEHRLSDAIEALAQHPRLSNTGRAELLPSGIQPRFDNKADWARTWARRCCWRACAGAGSASASAGGRCWPARATASRWPT